jgi:hypothetical protein
MNEGFTIVLRTIFNSIGFLSALYIVYLWMWNTKFKQGRVLTKIILTILLVLICFTSYFIKNYIAINI